MHLAYPEQLAHKRRLLGGALSLHPELGALAPPEIAAAEPRLGYRRRLKWLVGPAGELGMLARDAEHEVVDTPDCLVATALLRSIAASVRARLLGDAALRASVSAIDLREVDTPAGARALLAFVVRGARPGAKQALEALAPELARAHAELAGVALEQLPAEGARHFGGRIEPLWGASELDELDGSLRLLATHGAFTQAHRPQATRLAAWLGERAKRLGEAPRVLELYAGSGALGLSLAARGASVCFVESHRPALERAVRAGERAGLEVRGAVDDAEHWLVGAERRRERFDLVIVDPPRRGLPPELRQALARLSPKVVAYVSCNPTTLARDLAHLARLGLGVRQLRALDMIPQTDEVEALALLEPTTPPALRSVHVDERCVVFELPPFTSAASVLEATRALTGWPDPELAHPLPTSASGLCAVARDGATRTELERGLSLEALVATKSVLRAKGRVARPVGAFRRASTTYRRLAVASGHSFATLRATPASLGVAFAHLASLRHPVLGDPTSCDPPTRKHFFEKHGLDRAFAHVTRLSFPSGLDLVSQLAGDLEGVARSLGVDAASLRASPSAPAQADDEGGEVPA